MPYYPDGTGRGPLFPFTPPPLAATWTWVNQGTSTVDESLPGSIYLLGQAFATDNHRDLVRAVTQPYVATFGLLLDTIAGQSGVLWRQSSDGKEVGLMMAPDNDALALNKMTNPTTFSASYGTFTTGRPLGIQFYRLIDNGTNRIVQHSRDKVHWRTLHTVGRTDFLTADQIGIWVNPNSATWQAGLLLLSYELA